MFAQKEDSDKIPVPIVNSKYQETVFQKVFNAQGEDIGNTSYDASLCNPLIEGKFLIGLKTFGFGSGDQKIAQFKTNNEDWADIVNQISKNARNEDGSLKSKEEINSANAELYLELAKLIAAIRNKRIGSSISNIKGFQMDPKDDVESIYHVLMPAMEGEQPVIQVGEISYDPINIEAITIIGCTTARKPTNFVFTDGNHTYRFTSADSQLLMDFDNEAIVKETWQVKYADDAYGLFSDIAD